MLQRLRRGVSVRLTHRHRPAPFCLPSPPPMPVAGGLPLAGAGATPERLPRINDCVGIVAFSRSVIRTVVSRNLADAAAILELYAPYEYLLSEEARLSARLAATPAPSLADCDKMIAQVLRLGGSLPCGLLGRTLLPCVPLLLLHCQCACVCLAGACLERATAPPPCRVCCSCAIREASAAVHVACYTQYKATASDIMEHAPKDLALDLFLVNCVDMNNHLVAITSAMIKLVLMFVERCACGGAGCVC
jgi:hypothetical protein